MRVENVSIAEFLGAEDARGRLVGVNFLSIASDFQQLRLRGDKRVAIR